MILDRLREFWPFKPPAEKRSTASGITSALMFERASYLASGRGAAELTATAQSCVSLWEHGLSLADVEGTNLLTRRIMALIGRSCALRGEAVLLIRDGALIPCSDWDLSTRDGRPTAYRLTISEAAGGRTETALAAEIIHLRLAATATAPWHGSPPLKRAAITANLLNAVEAALAEVYDCAPLGSQIIPFPESAAVENEKLARSFRGQRGRVLLRESVNVTAAGGPAPASDWKPADLTPDLERALPVEVLAAARESICTAFGWLPAAFTASAQGPLVREAQRHLATWTLQPIASLLAEEASEKLGSAIEIDVLRPLQAFDAGGRARALSTIIGALALAKESGLAPGDINAALTLVNWGKDDGAA